MTYFALPYLELLGLVLHTNQQKNLCFISVFHLCSMHLSYFTFLLIAHHTTDPEQVVISIDYWAS